MLNFSPDHLDRHATRRGLRGGEGADLREPDEPTTGPSSTPTTRRVLRLARATPGAGAGRSVGSAALGDGHDRRGRLDRAAAARGATERLVPLTAIHLLGPHLVDDVMAAATVGALAGVSPAAMTAAVDGVPRARARDGAGGRGRRRAVRQRLEGDQRRGGAAVDRELRARAWCAIVGGRFKGGDLRPAARAARGAGEGGGGDRRSAAARVDDALSATSCRCSEAASMDEAVRRGVRAGAAGGRRAAGAGVRELRHVPRLRGARAGGSRRKSRGRASGGVDGVQAANCGVSGEQSSVGLAR